MIKEIVIVIRIITIMIIMIMINDINNNVYIYIVNGGSSQSRIFQSDTCHTKFQAAASQASFDPADPTAISGRPRPPSCYALWLQGSYALPTLHLTTGSLSLRFLRHSKLNWRWKNASWGKPGKCWWNVDIHNIYIYVCIMIIMIYIYDIIWYDLI